MDSNTLVPGYYEENIGTSILQPSDASAWATQTSFVYSGGAALRAYNTSGAQDIQTLTFQFTGTGVSVISSFGTIGGELELNVTDGGTINITKDFGGSGLYTGTRRPYNRYGVSLAVAGLPQGTYTATLTITNDNIEQTIIDAIEVYGTLPQLGSLYDDADVDANGTPLIAYGPVNNSWVELTGTLAVGALNRTLHSGNLRGSVAAFEIGVTEQARGIVLYYDDRSTAVQAEICFRDVLGIAA
ncbi:MAG: hypothetical protein Q9P01_12890, partial [Anaerolineae bacterium]|nr:hypothetical protein [Anaerolineae bacterium]